MKRKATILLVEDEDFVRLPLAELLTVEGYQVRQATSVEQALRPDSWSGADLILCDLRLGDGSGLDVVRALKEKADDLPIIILTGHGSVASAVECMKAGARDYLLKPTSDDELRICLERALVGSRHDRERRYLRREKNGASLPIGESLPWRRVLELAELAASADSAVLLIGETGSGKEEIARLIHRRSRRATAPFVAVNCAAFPLDLFESEFFGHRRGAFTGASADRDGRFRVADSGTLLLDEINSLPQAAQAKLLRVLEEGAFTRLGDSRPTQVDVRLLAASNVDLEQEARAGRFRSDLLYRINVLTIALPPLRERRSDIRLLAEAFLADLTRQLGKEIEAIEPEALARLEAYDWPGNVRELKNVIERGLLLEQGPLLSSANLPFAAPGDGSDLGSRNELSLALTERKNAAERAALSEALERSGGVRREAARLLEIDERNLAYFLKKHDLMAWERS
jgi:DNA-binding NtrC family response regulator